MKISLEPGALAFISFLGFPNVLAIWFVCRMVYILHYDDSNEMFYRFSWNARNGIISYIVATPIMFMIYIINVENDMENLLFFLSLQIFLHPLLCVTTIIFYNQELNAYSGSLTHTLEMARVATPGTPVGTPVVDTVTLPTTTLSTTLSTTLPTTLPTDLREWRPWFESMLSAIRTYEEDIEALQQFRSLLVERQEQRRQLQQQQGQQQGQQRQENSGGVYAL